LAPSLHSFWVYFSIVSPVAYWAPTNIFIIGNWKTKVGGKEIPGIRDKFGLGIQNKGGQRLTEFFQENSLVMANTLFQQHEKTIHMDITRWSTVKSD